MTEEEKEKLVASAGEFLNSMQEQEKIEEETKALAKKITAEKEDLAEKEKARVE